MYCTHCRTQIEAGSAFCANCGERITGRAFEAALPGRGQVEASNLLSMRFVLRMLSRGQFFRHASALFLRVVAVAISLGGLVGLITGLKSGFGELEGVGVLGGIIFQFLLIVAIAMVVQILWIRAKDILDLPEADYTIIPLGSILLKLTGETSASFLSVLSVGVGIFVWLAGRYPTNFLLGSFSQPFGFEFGTATFMDGVWAIATGMLSAFLDLVFFYFVAETLVIGADIAKNTRVTSQIAEQYGKTKGRSRHAEAAGSGEEVSERKSCG